MLHRVDLRLNQQVENLLNMSRLESGYLQAKKDWCDVNELVYSVVNHLEDKLKLHPLKVEINEKLPLFKLDFGLIEQVIYNLVNNAIIYTEPDTVITITADSTTQVQGHFIAAADSIRTHTDSLVNFLILNIADNGRGFPPDEIENVFDKFYRLKNSQTGGTGLGLSIAKGFVEAHNGTIHLSNIPGGGAKFSIRIPTETSSLKQTENEQRRNIGD
jgi:two-component system sensor histidine kinase KdpD